MRDFNDYKKSTVKSDLPFGKDALDMLGVLGAKYEGKGANEIMKDIIAEAEKGRRNGTLKDEDIDSFKAVIEPMLDEKQRKTLDLVVKKLKKGS